MKRSDTKREHVLAAQPWIQSRRATCLVAWCECWRQVTENCECAPTTNRKQTKQNDEPLTATTTNLQSIIIQDDDVTLTEYGEETVERPVN